MDFLKNKEFKVGLLAIGAFAVLYLGINFLQGSKLFSSSRTYYVTYANSKGLSGSSPVLVNGKTVGKVRQVKVLPEEGYKILVTLDVQQEITVTDTTVALLVNFNLLGEKAIELRIKDGDSLKEGDTLIGRAEQGAVEIFGEGVLPAFGEDQDPVLLAGRLAKSIVENLNRVDGVFANVEEIAAHLKDLANASASSVEPFNKGLKSAAASLTDKENGIAPLLIKLNKIVAGVDSREAAKVLTKANNILSSLESAVDTKKNAKSLYNQLSQAIDHLDELIVDIKEHPDRYVRVSLFRK